LARYSDVVHVSPLKEGDAFAVRFKNVEFHNFLFVSCYALSLLYISGFCNPKLNVFESFFFRFPFYLIIYRSQEAIVVSRYVASTYGLVGHLVFRTAPKSLSGKHLEKLFTYLNKLKNRILEKFLNRRKLLCGKDLRQSGPPPPALSRYIARSYVEPRI
jgi:hypothetical protein